MKDGKVLILAVVVILLLAGSAMAAELTVTKQGCGEGTVIGEGIYCDPDSEYSVDCSETYPDETILHLEAVPEDDSEFLGWLVDGEPQEGTLIIRKDITVTAIFEKKPQQVPELEIVGTRTFQRVQAEDILDKRIVFLRDGTHFQVEPLDNVVVSKDRNRVLVYGGHLGDLELASIDTVFIYSGTGELLRSVETKIAWPLQSPPFAVEDNGAFWMAGIPFDAQDSFILKKYSKDGDLLWEHPLPIEPKQLKVSLDNSFTALMLHDFYTAEIQYYKNDGTLVYARELPFSFYGVEFIAPQKVLLYSADEWELYHLDDLDTPFVSGRFKGNPSEILAMPQVGSFLIKSFKEEPCREGWFLQAVDAETGQAISERFFEKDSSTTIGFVRITEQGTVEVLLDGTTIMELRIPG